MRHRAALTETAMRHVFPLAALLLLAPLPLLAQTATDAPRARTSLDANHDGAIDRGEAATSPRFAARFDQLDANKDGRLTRNERGMHHKGMHGHRGKRGMRHGGIERLDTDKDGRISRAEFATLETRMAEMRAKHGDRAGRASARKPLDFAAIDANRDGHLVRSELRAHHERMRPQREAERKARMDAKFAGADLNKDGRLGRVEVEQALPGMGERFNWMDENRDGFLSRGELSPGRGHRR
jgi:Ca2+-binding EF-hand superfamily protein